ncbi:hypothetical protein [Actinomadura sp. NPDC000600]|uniref:hypothetical protein n=1 Tax=Actinomadura sp. NPDC000600 TaxID=3154262 RepID=UPI0033961FDD
MTRPASFKDQLCPVCDSQVVSGDSHCTVCGGRLLGPRSTPDLGALKAACLHLAAGLVPAANAVAAAAARAEHASTGAVARAAGAAGMPAHIAKAAARKAAVAADAADAARYAAEAVLAAANAADAATTVEATGAQVRTGSRATDAARAAEAAAAKVTVWPLRTALSVAEAVWTGTDAAVLAMQETRRVFTSATGGQAQPRAVTGTARRPGVLTRRLLAAGCALLPAGTRGRYAEEWLSLLTELPTRRARAVHVLSILCGAPRQAWTLRRPLKHVPPV